MKKILLVLLILLSNLFVNGCMLDTDETMSETENDKGSQQAKGIYMNETAKNKDGVEFMVTKVENTKVIDRGFYQTTTENNFVIVTVKITNNSDEAYEQNPLNVTLISGKTTFEYSTKTYYLDDGMESETINPGITKTYRIVFETAKTTNEVEYKIKLLDYSFFTENGVVIILKERS